MHTKDDVRLGMIVVDNYQVYVSFAVAVFASINPLSQEHTVELTDLIRFYGIHLSCGFDKWKYWPESMIFNP